MALKLLFFLATSSVMMRTVAHVEPGERVKSGDALAEAVHVGQERPEVGDRPE